MIFRMEERPSLFGLTLEELQTVARDLGAPLYAARQIAGWLYARHAPDFETMTDLSKRLRHTLAESFTLERVRPTGHVESRDGTRKYLFPTPHGNVEAAFIPDGDRATLCLSTQVGCRMGCRFCMTGKQGLQGNLGPQHILSQYSELPERDRLTNFVFMGMGEPLDNLDNVLKALRVLTSDWGYGVADQRITVSTVGLLPKLPELLRHTQARFALSVHSPFDEERAALMPIQRAYPLSQVLETLRTLEDGHRRRLYVEYILFDGLNDSPRHARELARILHGLKIRVNLIKFHSVPGTEFRSTPRQRMEEFQRVLVAKGIQTNIRKSRGEDIEAACGLLSSRASYAG